MDQHFEFKTVSWSHTSLRNLLSWCLPSRVFWLKSSVISTVPLVAYICICFIKRWNELFWFVMLSTNKKFQHLFTLDVCNTSCLMRGRILWVLFLTFLNQLCHEGSHLSLNSKKVTRTGRQPLTCKSDYPITLFPHKTLIWWHFDLGSKVLENLHQVLCEAD